MSDATHWLTLIRAPRLGSGGIHKLLEAHGNIAAALEAAKATGSGIPSTARDWLRSPDQEIIDADLAWCERNNHHLICLDDDRYPALMRDCERPPAALFVIGDPDWLQTAQLAMVGSRNPTPVGADNARQFAAELARCGLTITSGLALGIDAQAHEGALEVSGGTVAVLGTGPDRVYPASHRDLAHRIAEQGALVTEFPPGTAPRKESFPQRNRIISGLSLGTVVVEAALQSGSLITARQATEQGREVFAIPGSIHNPLARGAHKLIRDGAKLVESAADILEELGPLIGNLKHSQQAENTSFSEGESLSEAHNPDPESEKLLTALGHDPSTVDSLIQRSGLTAEAVSSMLLILELEGRVARTSSGAYIRLSGA